MVLLPEIESPCIKVERNYKDLIKNKTLSTKSEFIEKLTHDSFVVQVNRIVNSYQTTLDKLLSIFEQTNFVDDKHITKEFNYPTDLEEVKMITDILHHSGTNPKERKQIEDEQEAWRSVNALFENDRKEYEKALAEKDKALELQRLQMEALLKELDELKRKSKED